MPLSHLLLANLPGRVQIMRMHLLAPYSPLADCCLLRIAGISMKAFPAGDKLRQRKSVLVRAAAIIPPIPTNFAAEFGEGFVDAVNERRTASTELSRNSAAHWSG